MEEGRNEEISQQFIYLYVSVDHYGSCQLYEALHDGEGLHHRV